MNWQFEENQDRLDQMALLMHLNSSSCTDSFSYVLDTLDTKYQIENADSVVIVISGRWGSV